MIFERPNRLHFRTLPLSDFLGRPASLKVFYQPLSLGSIHILNQGEGYVPNDTQPAVIVINQTTSVPCRIVTNERGNVLSILRPTSMATDQDFLNAIRFSREDGNEFFIYQRAWENKYLSDIRTNYIQGEGCKISIDNFVLATSSPIVVTNGGTNYISATVQFYQTINFKETYPVTATPVISGGQITSVSVTTNNARFTSFPNVVVERTTFTYTNNTAVSGTANAIWFVHVSPEKIPTLVTSQGREYVVTGETLKEIPLFPNDSFRLLLPERNEGLVGLQGISTDSFVRITIYQYNATSAPVFGTGLNLSTAQLI